MRRRDKGNTLVDISPRNEGKYLKPGGHSYPIHQRKHYKANWAQMKEVTRYVATYTIRW